MTIDAIPIWVFFVGTILLILGSVEVGFALGKRAVRRSPEEKESPAAAVGGAVLGLVAFMLAFTFSIASGRFDARKQLVRDDAEAIRTAWLRADFLPEPDRSKVRSLLREYLDVRVAVAESRDITMVRAAQTSATAIQKQLWSYVVAHGKADLNTDIGALLVESINEVINIHAVRVAVGVDMRIPGGIWLVLYALSVLGMVATGYQMGVAGPIRSKMELSLAVAFALVISLIAGLDQSRAGLIPVSQKPLHDVRAFMDGPGGS